MTEALIVVPLDGSELSEGALPYARVFARTMGCRLLLVTVWEGSEPTLLTDLPAVAKDLTQRAEQYYQEYLQKVARDVEQAGIEVETSVLVGHPAEEILRLLAEREPRLLVMATHGRSGLGRWWYGSVASKVVREAPLSTVVAGPKVLEARKAVETVRRILVPLDGSSLAEAALRPALELAEAFGATLVLVQVLGWASQSYVYGVPDVDVARIDRELTKASQDYLGRVREALTTERPVETKVLHGLPADSLIDYVAAEGIDLVVMMSHGRTGLARVALGSVADRMLQATAPVLLVRPQVAAPIVREAPRSPHCHACGRAVPYGHIAPDERCLRCGQHLHVCGNCVYFDGITCLLQRPEVHDAYPGQNCPEFHFRETPTPAPRR